jgi:replicative DNA helicase
MTKDEAILNKFSKETAKNRLEEYLNIITTKKGKQYICPLCGSGTGKNKTPAGQFNADNTFHCFACEFHGDIFKLVARIEGITDDAEKFKRVYDMFNIIHNDPKSKVSRADERQPPTDYTEYFKKCHAKASETDYFSFRGLTKATIDKFMLGFDHAWQSPKALSGGKNPPVSPRIIIPTSKGSYIARAIDPNADPKYKAIKEGKSELFNKKALQGTEPVFIVEGEIDALSVVEADRQALALGSTGNKSKFIEMCRSEPPQTPLILSLDNDGAGRKTQAEIADALKSLRIAFLEANISGEYKDPNEYLTSDSDTFKRIINDISDNCLQMLKDEADDEREKYINETSVTSKIDNFLNDIKASVDTPVIPTNFTELDKILDDGLYEGLYILGAISSLGKTSFALQIADQIAQQGHDILIFSLEMARAELMAKSISRITFLECGDNIDKAKTTRGITSGKRHVNYSREEKAHINDSIKKYASYTDYLFIYEGAGNIGAEQVREITETHIKVTGKNPVVIIDYLQILAPHEPRATDKQNTDKAIFELKRLSRDLKIPVIGVSSLNRENYNSNISMSAFKESGAIEYSSDVLMGLQFEAMGDTLGEDNSKITSESINRMKRKYPRKIELKILKNRNGSTGDSITFDYYPMFNYFHETGKKVIEESKPEIIKGNRR